MLTQFLETCLILKVNISETLTAKVRTDAMEIVNIRFHDTEFLSRIEIYISASGVNLCRGIETDVM
jgi:hypothetical protein